MKRHVFGLAKYGIIGVVNTVVYSGLLFLFLDTARLGSATSVTLAYLLANLYQFFAHRRFTFASRGSIRGQAARYVIAATASYGISLFIVWLTFDIYRWPSLLVILVCAAVTSVFGYLTGYFWVYRGDLTRFAELER